MRVCHKSVTHPFFRYTKVRYKSFSLPPHYRHHYRQITFYRSRKSPTFFFLIKFPNNFIRFSVFICNFAANF